MNERRCHRRAFQLIIWRVGRVLLDYGATDIVGSGETIEAIIDKSQEAFGTNYDWVSADTND